MNEIKRGYLSDPLIGDFTAKVMRVEETDEGMQKVWLDSTYFYPESGGQPDDRGTLGGFKVKGVSEDDLGVCHLVSGRLEVGDTVNGHVDMARRFDHMQQHTGQHILSRVFVSLSGLMTVGFHLGEKACTIDLSGKAPDDLISRAEREANAVVFQDLEVGARVVSRDEFESEREESGDMRSRLPEGVGNVRIIEIEDMDSSTCCGTHCQSTGMVGIIKITGTEVVRSGTRVEFICGGRALGDYGEKHALMTELSSSMSTDWHDLKDIVEKLVSENKSVRKERDSLIRELAGFRAAEIGKPTGEIGGYDVVRRVFENAEMGEVREIVNKVRESGSKIVLFGTAAPVPGLIFACSPGIDVDMGAVLKEAAEVIGARGGGGKDFAQGGGGDPSKIEEALKTAEEIIGEMLE
jgi:alanyl-tRNA synthetase